MRSNKFFPAVILPFVLSSAFLLTSCNDQGKSGDNQNEIPTANIKVFDVKPLTYTLKISLPARVVASQVAEIRPQVGGIILKREFTESSNVEAGQSLYQIDPAIYQANFDSAVANVASAKANANIAHLTLKRYQGLLKTKSISQQDYDKASAEAQQADASVAVAEANQNTAKVNLGYTKVYSPIDGYIGKSSVTEGALVSADQTTPLAVVQKLDPIYIDMTEAATRYEKFRKDQNVIYEPASEDNVRLYFNDGSEYQKPGNIKFSDMSVDQTTGTITLRSIFANPDSQILPGMFVKPQLTLGYIKNAVLVPQPGITSDAKGQYTAKILRPDNTIEYRTGIEIYTGLPGYWVVTKGIDVGDQVIVSGLLNLTSVESGAKMKGKVIEDAAYLTQSKLDELIENNMK